LYAAQAGVAPFALDAVAERAWLAYPFPGNVRELRNIVIRLTTKHAGKTVSVSELEPEFDLETSTEGEPERDLTTEAQRDLERGGFSLDQTLKAWERAYVEAALRMTRGNMSQAAKLLGVNRTTLYSRIGSEAGDDPGSSATGDAVPGPQGVAPQLPRRK
jgi:DNA-binding NtrC family response regulator